MEIIGGYVDRLITVQMRPRVFPVRGRIHELYEAAREKLAVKSLTLLAAQKVIENVKDGDNVFVVTGVANRPYLPHGETDGPPGAASIARAVSLGLNANPIFVVGEGDVEGVKGCARAAGLGVEDYQSRNTTMIVPVPVDDETARRTCAELIDRYDPKAVFSIETLGPNSKGVHHTVLGFDLTEKLPKLHHVFDEANKRGILTIAGIDGGNELGSGSIEEAVRRVMPYGNVCQCPCQSGNACCTKADVVIPANTSNWALYGVSAMLALLLKKPDLLQDADTEHRMLEACVAAGVVDGVTFRPIVVVDGVSDKANQSLVNLLHEIVHNGLIEEGLKRPI